MAANNIVPNLSKSTLFVRGLPLAVSKSELEPLFLKFFGTVGPVSSGFLVGSKENADLHKGIGYIHYSQPEDAEKAMKELKGKLLLGTHKIKFNLAKKKQSTGKKEKTEEKSAVDDDEETPAVKANIEDKAEEKKEEDPLPEKSEVIAKPVKSGGYSALDLIVTGIPEEVTRKQLFKRIKKATPHDDALKAYPIDQELCKSSALLSFPSKDALIKAQKNLNEHIFKGSKLGAIQATFVKEFRVIVRNLSFTTKEKAFKAWILSRMEKDRPFQILEIELPIKEQESMNNRGFGFVQFIRKEDADLFIEKANGTKWLGRLIVVDYCLKKAEYEKRKNEEVKEEAVPAEEEIAGDAMEECSPEEEEEEGEKDCEEELPVIVEKEVIPIVKKVDDVDEGRTVFIRNVPLDASVGDIRKCLSTFGPIEFCKFVRDRLTGDFKGTAFVKFASKEVAENIVQSSKLAFTDEVPKGDANKKSSSSLAIKNSLLVKEQDLMDDEGAGVYFQGKPLAIFPAINQNRLQNLHNERDNLTKVRNDKQNLYLLKEGLITSGSPEAENVPQSQLEKYMASYRERKEKLKNPNFYISKTRLSIRNLPVALDDDKVLRKLCIEAASRRLGQSVLVRDIKQAKIVRSKDRVNAKGVAKSMGFAFVEFADHEMAMAALHEINNNPLFCKDFGGGGKRPMVEFAIENGKIVKLRSERVVVKNNGEKETTEDKSSVLVKEEGEKEKSSKKSPKFNDKGNKQQQQHNRPPVEKTKSNVPSHSSPSGPPKRKFNAPVDSVPKKAKVKNSGDKTDSFDALVNSYVQKLKSTQQ